MSAVPSQPNSRFDSAFLRAYEELRSVARRERRSSPLIRRQHHTTSLVHEAFIRLSRSGALEFHDDHHLLRIAARAMRHFLVDDARRHMSAKRGSGRRSVELSKASLQADPADYSEVDIVTLSDALTRLAELDARKAEVVELRFFGGISIDQVAELMSVSTATVVREWKIARSWLYQELQAN